MPLADYILYRLAKKWPSPMAKLHQRLGAEPGTDAYYMAYAQEQFNQQVRVGIQVAVVDREVLEIGCGHGGISCFLAVAGARRVVGIDLDPGRLTFARRYLENVNRRLGNGCALPVTFHEENATKLTFPDESFDLVFADNVFEHFTDPEAVLREAHRVLRPGGHLLVPVFSSILSKHGLHLKHGVKMPWANIYFSEKTIVRTMHRLAADDPKIMNLYPGLRRNPQTVRDLREYSDLNDITYKRFLQMADGAGFDVEWFRPCPTHLGQILRLIPLLRRSILRDIFSTGASAYLKKKPAASA